MAITIRLVLAIYLVIQSVSALKEPKLIWEENFDWLDESRWHHLVTAWRGGNDEFQYYRNNRKNSWVENGVLKIRATPVSEEMSDHDIRWGQIREPGCNMEPCVAQGNGEETVSPVFSARIHTQGSFSTKYGIVKVSAKMPRGDWLFPAIWMLPESNVYGPWPVSGEIDITENRCNRYLFDEDGNSQGIDLMFSTLNWGTDLQTVPWWLTHWEVHGPDFSSDFHLYEVEWTDEYILFRLDGTEIGRITPSDGGFWELGGFPGENIWKGGNKMTPFDQNFHIIINTAVGGVAFNDTFTPPHPWNLTDGHPFREFYENQDTWYPTWDRPTFEIDYIHVYEL